MECLKDTHIGDLCIEGMQRTEAFQKDLNYYLGPNWTVNYKPRESVAKYLLHLKQLEKTDPNMLMAYIYHLYMGLLSGGQILRKKRSVMRKLNPFSTEDSYSDAVTDFGNYSIFQIKKDLVDAMNSIANILDDKTKSKLIEESKRVFLMNNEIIRSVQGANVVILKKLLLIIIFLIVIMVIYYIM